MVAYAQRVRHDRECRIHRAGGAEEASVNDVQVIHFVRFAVASSAEVFGSFPKRMVPFWCATPARGMRWPTNRLRDDEPSWQPRAVNGARPMFVFIRSFELA